MRFGFIVDVEVKNTAVAQHDEKEAALLTLHERLSADLAELGWVLSVSVRQLFADDDI